MATTKENNEANRIIDAYLINKDRPIISIGNGSSFYPSINGCSSVLHIVTKITKSEYDNITTNMKIFKAMFDKLDDDIMKD